jgi:hypothetical protein
MTPVWMWYVLPAVTMSLGWGLRGYIGGGSLGAMIPGAMVGLALCLLLRRETGVGLVAALAAVGVGFGGQETYGQTVGLSFVPETYSWAILGFAIKGAVWGFLGGAFIAIALTRERYQFRDLLIACALMIAGTWVGWKLINEPRLIYFSNLHDRPRAELWAGLWLGALLVPTYLSFRGGARIPWLFAVWGALGGGVGFAAGAALQVWGRSNLPMLRDWWKMMEFTFGALLGMSYGHCARMVRNQLQPASENHPGLPASVMAAIAGIACAIVLPGILPLRFDYTVAGAMLIALSLASAAFRWQTAMTVTYCAFAYDLLRNRPDYPTPLMWSWVILTTALTIVAVYRMPRTTPMFSVLTASAVGTALLKSFLPVAPYRPPLLVDAIFVVMAVLVLLWTRQVGRGVEQPVPVRV